MRISRVNEIDLLRFIAALAVVLFHYAFRGYAADSLSRMPYPLLASPAKYGYLGVELFFMISGFVIMMTASSGSLRSFVISRAVRLYPGFWACCTITFLVGTAIGGRLYSATIQEYAINMTMLSEYLGTRSIDGVYWSLFIEIRFYALVSVILIMRGINRSEMYVIIWLLASALLYLFPTPKLQYLLITDYSAFFIAGATYSFIWAKGLSPLRAAMIGGACLLAIVKTIVALPAFEKHYGVNMNRYAVVGIIIAFFGIMLLVSVKQTGAVGRRNWVLLGALTYPLYLLHQNIGFIIINLLYPNINMHIVFWGAALGAITLAYFVHVTVEKPLSPLMKTFLTNTVNHIDIITMPIRNSIHRRLQRFGHGLRR